MGNKKILPFSKKILIEKPGFNKNIEFIKIKKILSKSKSQLQFGYVYVYNNYIQYIKKIINNKNFGKIKYIKFLRQNFGPIRNDVNSFLDLATHDLSIVKFLFNKKITYNKHIKHDILKKNSGDVFYSNFKCQKIRIDISVSWLHPEKIRKILIITTKKMILYDEMDSIRPLKIFNNYASYPKIYKYSKKYFSNKAFIYKGNSNSIKLSTSKPLDNEIKSFLKNDKNIADIFFSHSIFKLTKKLV